VHRKVVGLVVSMQSCRSPYWRDGEARNHRHHEGGVLRPKFDLRPPGGGGQMLRVIFLVVLLAVGVVAYNAY